MIETEVVRAATFYIDRSSASWSPSIRHGYAPSGVYFHKIGQTRLAKNLFSCLRRLRVRAPVACLTAIVFDGVKIAAMV
ncbi:hypothetical protein [Rhizobium mongolense]|uniref:hypothetical protein n=1 Tax=Rhizobium mongolense TaxID=57676 RepID=UPI0034A473DE